MHVKYEVCSFNRFGVYWYLALKKLGHHETLVMLPFQRKKLRNKVSLSICVKSEVSFNHIGVIDI